MTLIGVRLGMRALDMSDYTQVDIAIASGHLDPGVRATAQTSTQEAADPEPPGVDAAMRELTARKKRDMPALSLRPGDQVFYLPDPAEGDLSKWILVAPTPDGNWIAAVLLENGQAAVDRPPTKLATTNIFVSQTEADYEAACRLSKEPKRLKRGQSMV